MEIRLSPNFNDRPDGQPVDMLILHYTGMTSAEAALERLCDPAAEVSAHYLIREDGSVVALVPEDKRAWHAGKSFWRGDSGINARSIGIELVNPGHEFGYRPFPAAQMDALKTLCQQILARHPIPARHVLGHSDVAPARKQDPGELFDWRWLARQGIGLWPEPAAWPATPEQDITPERWTAMLGEWGYCIATKEDVSAARQAFDRHFHPVRRVTETDTDGFTMLSALLQMSHENTKNDDKQHKVSSNKT